MLGLSAGSAGAAPALPTLGLAAPYAILAGAGVTTSGTSSVSGAVGILTSLDTSTGSASGLVGGLLGTVDDLLGARTVVGTTAVQGAQGAASSAYRSAASLVPTHVFGGSSLTHLTLVPGVYSWPGSLSVGSLVTLNARGNRNADFIFQIPGDLATLAHSDVALTNGAQASHVLWQVGGSAVLAPSTSMVGTILADHDITLGAGTRLLGRAFSLGGLVGLDASTVTLPSAAAVGSTVGGVTSGAASVVPSSGSASTGTSGTTVAGVSVPAALPLIPLAAIALPELAVPAAELPQVRSLLPNGLGAIPLGSLTSPVTLPTTSTPSASTQTPSSSAGGVSVPLLSRSPTSSLVPALTSLVPNLTLPSLGPSLTPRLATSPTSTSPAGKGSLVHAHLKASASSKSTSSPRAKSGSTKTSSGTSIPVGAPQTGLGATLGSLGSLRLVIAASALAIAAGFALLGVRRRHAHGWR
ncbi:MAG: ice-binding family protein [Acidimicrobiales bacterium]